MGKSRGRGKGKGKGQDQGQNQSQTQDQPQDQAQDQPQDENPDQPQDQPQSQNLGQDQVQSQSQNQSQDQGQVQDDDGFTPVTGKRGHRVNRNQSSQESGGRAPWGGSFQASGNQPSGPRALLQNKDAGAQHGQSQVSGGNQQVNSGGPNRSEGTYGGQRQSGGYQGPAQRDYRGYGRDGSSQGYEQSSSSPQNRSNGVKDEDIYIPRQAAQPSAKVSNMEKSIEQGVLDEELPNLNTLSLNRKYPLRPRHGTEGTAVTLWANYVEMIPPVIPTEGLTLYRYNIIIIAEQIKKVVGRKREQVVRLALAESEWHNQQEHWVSDFKTILISRIILNSSEHNLLYRAENEDDPPVRSQRYTVHIQRDKELSILDLINYLNSTNLSAEYISTKPEMIQALNILIHHYANSNRDLAAIGSSKTFLPSSPERCELGPGLMALRGYFSSVRVATGRILVNVTVSHGAFYADVPLTVLMDSTLDYRNRIDISKLRSLLNRVRVALTHLPTRRNRAEQEIFNIRTISGLATGRDGRSPIADKRQANPPDVRYDGATPKDVKFFLENSPKPSDQSGGNSKEPQKGKARGGPSGASAPGRYVTVSQYFKDKYQWDLQQSQYPVVNTGDVDHPTYFPAEVCRVLPGQACRSVLSGDQATAMINFACRNPKANALSIVNQGLSSVGLAAPNNTVLTKFGFQVPQELIAVRGRVLTKPSVDYLQRSIDPRFGTWNIIGCQMCKAGQLQSWTVLAITRKAPADVWKDAVKKRANAFHECLNKMGIPAPKPPEPDFLEIRRNDDPGIARRIKRLSESAQLLVIVLPDKEPSLFRHIKRIGDIQVGISTVCVLGFKFVKLDPQYLANVALKLNLKIGGDNQLVGRHRIITEDQTMIVGLDVTHPSPGSAENAPSVAGMVANVDAQLGQWPATLSAQAARQEMVVPALPDMLKSHLRLWHKFHSCYPTNIIVYRDGVSEGQYEDVITKELPKLREACRETYTADLTKAGLPRFTIIIVGKRHHTRFYPTRKEDAEKSTNPKPGTVVDRGITEARNWDFFLQAHSGLKGTARPAHYFVVLDEIFRRRSGASAADDLESLTHQLCYAYGRATKAVKVCMPTYYADLVCDRARHYLSQLYDAASHDGQGNPPPRDVDVHINLKDTMFYI